jgi:hypothetical protein
MMRVLLGVVGLTVWLAAGLGARAYWGGKAYLAELLGSEALADEAMAHALAQPEALVLGLNPWVLLLSLAVVVSASLVLVVLWPWDLLLRRLNVSRAGRTLAGIGLAAAATGAALSSVHPLLSLPSVPEGPRTVLNYACEAAGYGWVNGIAFVGAVVTGGVLAWLAGPVIREQPASGDDPAAPGASADATSDSGEADESAEPSAPEQA